MLTLEAASALLLVLLGASVLVIACMGAMIYAKARVSPHADCARILRTYGTELEEIRETLKRRGKQAGGVARGKQKKEEAEEEEETPAPGVSDSFKELQRKLAHSTRRLG